MTARGGRFLIVGLFLAAVAAPAHGSALDLGGDLEYLIGSGQKHDSPANPGDILNVPRTTHLVELQTRFASGDRLTIEWRGRFYSPDGAFSSHLDQAYVSFAPVRNVGLRIGRQRIGFGPGYVWNPVNDLDKRRNIYDPTRYTEGVNAAKASFDLFTGLRKPLTLSVEAVVPERVDTFGALQRTGIGTQLYLLARDIEFGLAASYSRFSDTETSYLFGAYSTIDVGGMILGFEYAGSAKPELPDLTAAGAARRDGINHQFLVNLNRRVSDTGFVLLEYFRNGFGYSDAELDTMVGRLRTDYTAYGSLIAGNLVRGYVSKDYLYGTFSQEIADFWTLTFSGMANLDRGGGFIYPQLAWTGIEDVTVSAEAITNVYYGKENEFSLDPYRNIFFLRLQYFF